MKLVKEPMKWKILYIGMSEAEFRFLEVFGDPYVNERHKQTEKTKHPFIHSTSTMHNHKLSSISQSFLPSMIS